MLIREEDYLNYLKHSGIKGMHWGVRKQESDSQRKSIKSEVIKLPNYKGKLYFISEENLDGTILTPRVPKNYFTENGHEDNHTPRVCFTPDVSKNLSAISQNISNKQFNVYEPVNKHDVYKPNSIAVPDSKITNELWVKEPVLLKSVGKIKVTGDDGKDGMKFEYGDKQAELYGWNYKWLNTK